MGELAVRAVDAAPLLGDGQDGLDLGGHQAVDGATAGRLVDEGPHVTSPSPPTVHPVVGHAPQGARPGMVVAAGDGLLDGLEDLLLDLGGDSRRERPD